MTHDLVTKDGRQLKFALPILMNSTEPAKTFTDLELLVLTAACDADPESDTARDQLASSTVLRREFTGCGVFVHFQTTSAANLRNPDGRILRGSQKVFLSHPDLEHGADAIVWIENGKMDCLELVVFGVEDWPEDKTSKEMKFAIRYCD